MEVLTCRTPRSVRQFSKNCEDWKQQKLAILVSSNPLDIGQLLVAMKFESKQRLNEKLIFEPKLEMNEIIW